MTLRVGLIGFGAWGPNLARNLAKHATVTWVCDPSSAAQKRASDAGYVVCNAPMWDECDAVAIASPIAAHFDQATDALARYKHVLCEKPVARTPDEAKWLTVTARSKSLTLMADHTWTAHRGVTRLLGDGDGFEAQRWASDARGLDPLDDLLPHDAALLRFHYRGVLPIQVRTHVHEDGNVGIAFDFGGEYPQGASYSYTRAEKRRLVMSDKGVNKGELPEGAPEPLDEIAREFVASCRTGRAPMYGGPDEIVYVAAVIDAAKKSREAGGRWVRP